MIIHSIKLTDIIGPCIENMVFIKVDMILL
jgi:hypothetical protein